MISLSVDNEPRRLAIKSEWADQYGLQICGVGFIIAWLALYAPVYINFAGTAWLRPENAHIPFILAICVGLAFARLTSNALPVSRTLLEMVLGFCLLSAGLLAYVWSRIQEVDLVLSASQIPIALGATLTIFGFKGISRGWFVFVLSLYLVTWPGWAIDMITFPLKMLVSQWVTSGLFALGMPVSHEGAIISAGSYELLVANACAGLNSLIALTSIGVVYLYIMQRKRRRTILTTLIFLAPIAIAANMVRVALLVTITLQFGYDAGQSFLHEASGLVMFAAALGGVFLVDAIASRIFEPSGARA